MSDERSVLSDKMALFRATKRSMFCFVGRFFNFFFFFFSLRHFSSFHLQTNPTRVRPIANRHPDIIILTSLLLSLCLSSSVFPSSFFGMRNAATEESEPIMTTAETHSERVRVSKQAGVETRLPK